MASFVAPPSTSKPRPQLAPDSYTGICYQMIDLGSHYEEYNGEKKDYPTRKLWLGFEFPTELAVFSDDKGEEPHSMGREYSFSMNDKSTLRKDLTSWRGQAWTDDEANAFDIVNLLGKPCQIGVIDYLKRNGERGVKIGSLGRVPKLITPPAPVNAIQAFSLNDEWDGAAFDKLPKFLQEKIKLSQQYKEQFGAPVSSQPAYAGPPAVKPATAAPMGNDFNPGDDDGDLPF